MGRKRNYDTEQLMLLIDEYFTEIKIKSINIGRITAEEIARHFKNNGREPNLEGYHIRSDSTAMEYIDKNLQEINEQISATVPAGDVFQWRTFNAYDFYQRHKLDDLFGLNIIREYLTNACTHIDKQYKVISDLQKQIIKLKEQLKESEKVILGKITTSDNHYANLIKKKREYSELEEKYNELYAMRLMDEEAMKMAALADMHVISINRKPNTYAKRHSYLGEPNKRTPSLNELLERIPQIETQKMQEIGEPYWKDIVDENDGGEK